MTVAFHIPEIETERLRLRLPKASDVDAHIAFRASEGSVGVGGPYDEYSSFHHLEGIIGQCHLRGYGRWMVADKTADEPYGIVGIYHPLDWPEPENVRSIRLAERMNCHKSDVFTHPVPGPLDIWVHARPEAA